MYDEKGRVHYGLVAQTEIFKQGIERLLTSMEAHSIVICSKGSPEKCHSTLLVARVLQLRGKDVVNIFPDGTVSVQENPNELNPQQPLNIFEEDRGNEWKSAVLVRPPSLGVPMTTGLRK